MLKRFCFFAAACLMGLPGQASANIDFAEERGGWTIVSLDDGCVMGMDFEGPGATRLVMVREPDSETLIVAVMNLNWSAKDDADYEVSIYLDEEGFGGTAGGYVDGVYKGFMAPLPLRFLPEMAKASSMYIYLGDQQIDQLSMDGTAVAIASLDRCTKLVKRDLAAQQRERDRFAHLPKDPFAPTPQSPAPGMKTAPEPLNQATWSALIANYPSRAIREGAEGRVSVRLNVGADGRVSSCVITGSSGHTVLDEATCRNFERYARFEPALDQNDRPVSGTFDTSVNYELPD